MKRELQPFFFLNRAVLSVYIVALDVKNRLIPKINLLGKKFWVVLKRKG